MSLLKAKKLFQEFLKQFAPDEIGQLVNYLRLVIDDYEENPQLFVARMVPTDATSKRPSLASEMMSECSFQRLSEYKQEPVRTKSEPFSRQAADPLPAREVKQELIEISDDDNDEVNVGDDRADDNMSWSGLGQGVMVSEGREIGIIEIPEDYSLIRDLTKENPLAELLEFDYQARVLKMTCTVCKLNKCNGFYYEKYCCNSCRTFFYKASVNVGNKKLRCMHSNRCDLGATNRRRCKKCRYKQCIDAGMVFKPRGNAASNRATKQDLPSSAEEDEDDDDEYSEYDSD